MSALYRVAHKTSYLYEGKARDLINELRLTPRVFEGQRVLAHSMNTSPEATIHRSTDPFGNNVVTVYVAQPTEEFRIHSESTILVQRQIVDEGATGSWFGKDVFSNASFRDHYFLYIMPTALCHTTAFLREWASDAWNDAIDLYSFLHVLNDMVYAFFEYRQGVTDVETGTEELADLRTGVCQDYAHWMLAALRMIGVPCRYVSGYLFSDPNPDERAYVGGQAMHAWIDVLVAENQWVGFDPTNQCMAGDRHIYLGVGRDYRDITPIRGVYRGALQTMSLDLSIHKGQ